MTAQQWNTLAGTTEFDGNVYMVWPILLEIIEKYFPEKKNLRALDFGCWNGKFCRKLHELGFQVTGTEIATDILTKARKNSPKEIRYRSGGVELLSELPNFHFISAIMVLPFINDFKNALQEITEKLEPGGNFRSRRF